MHADIFSRQSSMSRDIIDTCLIASQSEKVCRSFRGSRLNVGLIFFFAGAAVFFPLFWEEAGLSFFWVEEDACLLKSAGARNGKSEETASLCERLVDIVQA